MERNDSKGAESPYLKSPIRAAALLLGIYAAMHLAVGGILYVLNSPIVEPAIAGTNPIAVPSQATDAAAAAARVDYSD